MHWRNMAWCKEFQHNLRSLLFCHAILTINQRRLVFEFCLLFQNNYMAGTFTRGNPQVFQHQISSHSETKQKIQASGSIWTDDRIILFECIQNMNFFMLLGNHFLCFQHFSLSLFFSQSAEIEVHIIHGCTLYGT